MSRLALWAGAGTASASDTVVVMVPATRVVVTESVVVVVLVEVVECRNVEVVVPDTVREMVSVAWDVTV